MTWTFTLTGTERALAGHITGKIMKMGQAIGSSIRADKTEPEWQVHTMRGICAELMVARALNVYPNTEDGTPEVRNGWDFKYGASTIDVKCPARVGLNLVVPVRTKMFLPDAYVMAYETGELTFTLVGWTWASDVIRKENIRSKGDGPNDKWYQLAADELYAMDEIGYVQLGARREIA